MPDEDQAVGKVDSDVLERIGTHLSGSQRFEKVIEISRRKPRLQPWDEADN